jgi:hypothetical protein
MREAMVPRRLEEGILPKHFTVLVISSTALGASLVAVALLLSRSNDFREVVLAVGVALLTSGITTIGVTYLGTRLLEDHLVDAVGKRLDSNIGVLTERITESLEQLQSVVRDEMGHTKAELREEMRETREELSEGIGQARDELHVEADRAINQLDEELQPIIGNMGRVIPLFDAVARFGLESAYLTRMDALKSFARSLMAELHKAERYQRGDTKEQARIWIISSSMKGFVSAAFEGFDGREFIGRAAELAFKSAESLSLRILMTHPENGDQRATQEDRTVGAIPSEIRESLISLRSMGIESDNVRLYRGTPTVFAIATSDMMLLNPYPYGTEAFRSFSIVVRKISDAQVEGSQYSSDIYRQFEQHHFIFPWEHTDQMLQEEWDSIPVPIREKVDPQRNPSENAAAATSDAARSTGPNKSANSEQLSSTHTGLASTAHRTVDAIERDRSDTEANTVRRAD